MEKKAYWDDDFYQIVMYRDGKYITVDGFFYDVGEEGYEDPKQASRCVEYCGLEMPIEEFIAMRDANKDFRGEITELAASCKQYIGDMTPEDAEESMRTYYSGKAPTELAYEKITLDTPCGCYVDT